MVYTPKILQSNSSLVDLTSTPKTRPITTQDPNALATGAANPDYNTAITHATTQRDRYDKVKQADKWNAWNKRITDIQSGAYKTSNFQPGQTGQPGSTGTGFDQNPYIDAAFQRLTRGVSDDYKNEKNALEAQLYQTGNQPGSPLWDKEMRRLDDKYARINENAKYDATMAGQEAESAYVNNQSKLKEISLAMDQLNELKRSNKANESIAKQKSRSAGRGGGGGGGASNNPFSDQPYPGA